MPKYLDLLQNQSEILICVVEICHQIICLIWSFPEKKKIYIYIIKIKNQPIKNPWKNLLLRSIIKSAKRKVKENENDSFKKFINKIKTSQNNLP